MPYQHDTNRIRLTKNQDRRRKLTDDERELVLDMYKSGVPIRQIAREFAAKCSRQLISFIVHPDRYVEALKQRKDGKVWLKYYDRETHNAAMRSTRKHRAAIFGTWKQA